jgi:hypothetical protein
VTDAAGNVGSDSVTYTIDNTAPTIIYFYIKANALYTNTEYVFFNISAYDELSGLAEMRFQNDGEGWGGWVPYSASWSHTLRPGADGERIVYIQIKDSVGWISNANDAIILDKTAPTVTPTITGTLGMNGWYISTTTVTLTPSETATVYYYWDTAAEAEYTAALTAPECEHTLYYRAVDLAGNEKSGSVVVKVDKTAPTLTLTKTGTLGDNDYYTSTVTVTLTASDVTSGIATVEYKYAGSWVTYTAPFEITADDTYTVEYRATDSAGNPKVGISVTVKIDKTAPTSVSISINADAVYTTSAAVTLTLNATGETRLLVSNDQVTWLEYSASWTLSTGDGTKTVYLKAVDDAGNYEIVADEIIFDKTKPTPSITIIQSKTMIYVGETLQFSGTGSSDTNGIASYAWTVDGVIQPLGISMSHKFTAKGTYTVTLTVTDNASLSESATVTITVKDKPEPPGFIPGFEVLALIAAIGVAVVLLRKKH